MPLVIDCYNLLHQDMPADLAGLDTFRLCHILAASPWQGQRVVVVCDGTAHALAGDGPASIEVIYSGPHRSADDVIIELIDRDSAPRRITVVSSDREIGKAARRRKASWVTSDHFVGSLMKMIHQPQLNSLPVNQKPSHEGGQVGGKLSAEQVDRWLEVFEAADLAGIPQKQTQWQKNKSHDHPPDTPEAPDTPESLESPQSSSVMPQSVRLPDEKPFLDMQLGDEDDPSILEIDENDLRSWGYFRDA